VRPAVATVVQDDAQLLHRPRARIAATLDDLRALGVDHVRVTAGWSRIAPRPRARRRPDFDATDPAAYPAGAWRRLDRLDRMTAARGLRLAIDVAFFAPRWAVARPGRRHRHRESFSLRDYADFAEAVARRYPDAAAFTVWNEPNLGGFLLPQWERAGGAWRPASPHRYRAMVEAAVPRIRAAAPGALVLIGGTASVGAERGRGPGDRMAPLTFLRAMACVDARLRPLRVPACRGFRALPGDGWAHHPYSIDRPPWWRDPRPANVRMGDLRRLTGVLRRLHAAGRTRRALGLHLTEAGYQTRPPDPTRRVSLAAQARWLPEGERLARALPEVRSVAQFLVRDMPPRPGRGARRRWRDYQSGLRFADGRAKPAHAAYALGLVARRTGPRRVAFWGLVRPGSGRRRARIDVRARGGWRTLARMRTRDDGTLAAVAAVEPGRSFRLRSGRRAGAVLRGAR
jgi:hypothetical protein